MNPKADVSAINRELLEIELVERFHWLPQDIQNIPYKWLQKFKLIERQKEEAINTKQQIDEFKRKMNQQSKIRK